MRLRLLAATHLLALVLVPASPANSSPIISIAIGREMPTTIFVSTGLVFQSTDGGVHWHPTGPGLDRSVSKIVDAGGNRWFAATDSGVYRTTDGGDSWRRSSPAFSSQIYDLVAAPSSGFTLYASWSVGVFYSRDGGDSWWPAGAGLPPDHRAQLAVDPTDDEIVYAAGRGGLYVSFDAGANWARTPFAIGPFLTGGVLQAGIDPNRRETIYVSRLDSLLSQIPILARSDNGGVTSSDVLGTYLRLVFTIDNASTVFASTPPELVRSFDRGTTWDRAGAESPAGVTALAASPTSSLLLAGSETGDLYASPDHGTSWRRLTRPDSGCPAGMAGACLARGRFNVSVTFSSGSGTPSAAAADLLTDNASAFWFLTANNVEVVVKVVDGTAFNGRTWVFVAGLSDLEYRVEVRDLFMGKTWSYANPRGELKSISDTNAF